MHASKLRAPSPAWEGTVVTLVVWAALVAVPLLLGQIGISWDALNHHIYLGWTADHPRFDRDLLASSYQAFQYPYAYWPVYKLAYGGLSGAAAGAVLASLHATAIPAVWIVARSCIPGRTWLDAALRTLAVLLAFASGVVLSILDSTSNDLLAAIPLVWSVALGLLAVDETAAGGRKRLLLIALSGALAGAAVTLKLSNGPLAVLGPVLWMLAGQGLKQRVQAIAIGSAAAIAAFVLLYGHWGWMLWQHVGNPVYPFGDEYMAPVRRWFDWHP